MRVQDVLQKTTLFFREKGIESARLDTELLLSTALNWDRMKLYLNYDYPLSEAELNACRALVRRRSAGEPVAYILGHRDFFKHRFLVSPAVLIPRPETESLVEAALAWLQSSGAGAAPRMIDFGTGSGCIGLSLLAESVDGRLLAIDHSLAALEVAKANAVALGLSDRTVFLHLDIALLTRDRLEKGLHNLADLVVANPPYIAENDDRIEPAVKKFEPATALFSGPDGLSHLRVWSVKAAECLRPGGLALFEIGDTQAEMAKEIFSQHDFFSEISTLKDLSGRDRFVRAIRVDSTAHQSSGSQYSQSL